MTSTQGHRGSASPDTTDEGRVRSASALAAAVLVRRTRRVGWTTARTPDLAAMLDAAGEAGLAARTRSVPSIGRVLDCCAMSTATWQQVRASSALPVTVAADIELDLRRQERQRARVGGRLMRLTVADDLGVPLPLVDHLLGDIDPETRTLADGWPTVAGIDAVHDEVAASLPEDAVRVDQIDRTLLARAELDGEPFRVLTAPSPSGSVRAVVPAPARTAAHLLAAAASIDDGDPARALIANLAMRLESLARRA